MDEVAQATAWAPVVSCHGEMHNEEADRICDALARRQHGALTRRQMYEAGLTPKTLRARVAAHRLVVLYPDVFMPAAYPRAWITDLHGAVLAFGEGCLAGGRSAALLYELEGVDTRDVEVLVRSGRRLDEVIAHRLAPGDRPRPRSIDGIPVTSVERTLFDLAAFSSVRVAGLCIDDALRKRLTTIDRLDRALAGGGRRYGCRTFRQLLSIRDDRDGLLRSQLESAAMRTLRSIKAEPVKPNHEVRYKSHRYFLDFAFPRHRVAVETQGDRYHSGREKERRDLERDRHLSLPGWTVLYFTWDEVMLDAPTVRAQTEEALARAYPRLDLS